MIYFLILFMLFSQNAFAFIETAFINGGIINESIGQSGNSLLILEDGFYLLQEDGTSRIILE